MSEQTSAPRVSFLRELRNAAGRCTHPGYKKMLFGAADELHAFLDGFRAAAVITREDVRDLNCLWAYAERVLKDAPAEADPNPPLSGAPEAARLAA